MLGNCDPKFDCFGGIRFGAFILGINGFASSLSVLAAYIALNKAVGLEFTNTTIATTIAMSLVLEILTRIVLPGIAESIIGMVINWLAISLLLGGAAFLVQRNITNHSSSPPSGPDALTRAA